MPTAEWSSIPQNVYHSKRASAMAERVLEPFCTLCPTFWNWNLLCCMLPPAFWSYYLAPIVYCKHNTKIGKMIPITSPLWPLERTSHFEWSLIECRLMAKENYAQQIDG